MNTSASNSPQHPPLFSQQVWFVRLRWLAGVGVVVGGVLEQVQFQWYAGTGKRVAVVGGVILAYNVVLWALLRAQKTQRTTWQLRALAWLQILADLTCLTCLTVWTGGHASPLLGLYALHMVFAALLLPRAMAFAVAAAAIGMIITGLAVGGTGAVAGSEDARHSTAVIVGWGLSLLATVYLASHITRELQRHRRRLIRQNRRIKGMTERLRRQQQALVQQEKMVAMGQMAAGVAHEVANPLASMDGLLQLLERKPEKISPENFARLREQISRVNAIVRQLTAFAHPDEGQWQSADLNGVVNHALEVLRFDRRLKAMEVHADLAGGLPALRLLPVAIEQVVINLVINAVDAMASVPSPALRIRTGVDARYAWVEVQDNGEGIKAEHRERIFEPFFTTKPVGKGTGLGLSISYSLVRKHGGTIEVESSPGKGTSFKVKLPLGGDGRPKSEAKATPKQMQSAD